LRYQDGKTKVVYFAFGFEGIDDGTARHIVMRRALDWLLGSPTMPVLSVTPDNLTVSKAGGNATLNVQNIGAGVMDWTAIVIEGSSWLSITSGSSGTSIGAMSSTIKVAFTANTEQVPKMGIIRVTSSATAIGSPKDIILMQNDQLTETEPNNTASLANRIVYGDSVDAAIEPFGDVDYYRFTASVGDTVEVLVDNRDISPLQGAISLYDTSGVLQIRRTSFGSTVQLRMMYVVPSSGTYYLRYAYRSPVGRFPNAISVNSAPADAQIGTYHLRLRKITPSVPLVTSFRAANRYSNSAMLFGTVDPNGLSTTVTFEYGTTTNYGSNVVATPNPVVGVNTVDVEATLTGLSPNTTYNYRLIATNSAGSVYSRNGTFPTPPSPQGWARQTSGTTNTLHGVSFTDANTGTVVGDDGTILRTTDGGSSWTPQASGTTKWLYGVAFIDANGGTAVGSGGIVLRTTNGGTTWTRQDSGATVSLLGVSFGDANNGTAVGDGGTILRTTNSGVTWTRQGSWRTYIFSAVSFTDANTGTVVGTDGIILRTTNGGATWDRQFSGVMNTLKGVTFTDANTGTVVGDGGMILRTTNGGISWLRQASGTAYTLNAVSFADADRGIAVGWAGTIVRTTNGGVTWKYEHSGTGNELFAVSFVNPNAATVVDEWGGILRSTREVAVEQVSDAMPTEYSLSQNFPNPFNLTTTIEFDVPKSGYITLKVYNVLGGEVATLVDDVLIPGRYAARFNAAGLASGVYFYRLQAGNFVQVRKMILLR
jgi:photosystem II stability/assembly factor-like uncharacterized protein